MKTQKINFVSIVLMMLLWQAWPSSAIAGAPSCVPPGCVMERPAPGFDLDRSNYVLPNGMQYSQVLNMQHSNAKTSDLTFQSALTLGLSGVTQIGQVAVDAQGNRYVTGGFTGSIEYDGVVVESTGGYDFFLAKLSPDGALLWYQLAHGSEEVDEEFSLDGGLTLAVNNNGFVYVGGSFVKELHFTDNNGEVLMSLSDGRDDDLINLELFVAKYNPNGRLLWALGGDSGSEGSANSLSTGINTVNSIMLDNEGYPYIAGAFSGTNLFGEEFTVQGDSDFFIVSLAKNGSYMYWADVFGTPGRDYATSISVDGLGYLNILGVVGEGRMDLPDSDIYWDNDTGNSDTFVISYDVNGEWYFASFMGAGDDIVGNTVASAADGSFYVGGFFSGNAYFEGSNETIDAVGYEDAFLVKYDIDGDMIWVRQFGFEVSTVDVIKLDENEDVIVLGRYTDSIIFDMNSDTPVMLTTESDNNIYMAKFDSSGNFIWAKNIDGSEGESANLIFDEATRPFGVNPLDIVTSTYNGGEIILTGDFTGTLKLDDITLTSNGTRKIFMGVMPTGGAVSIGDDTLALPAGFELSQNYPNPFNPTTNISFSLPEASQVAITVYNTMGQRVGTIRNEMFAAGRHTVTWDAAGLASGVYMYKLSADNFTKTKKMTLVK
ncbi:MAG: T9SS type A sorting domain-containing protein [Balneolales bacterium]|nr:T9SS type A sorting domain-containing protein [Balneolales bacterium]